MNNLEISIATSSGTRKCFACGSIILDRTIVIGYRTEITLHEKCFKNLSSKMQEFLGGKK